MIMVSWICGVAMTRASEKPCLRAPSIPFTRPNALCTLDAYPSVTPPFSLQGLVSPTPGGPVNTKMRHNCYFLDQKAGRPAARLQARGPSKPWPTGLSGGMSTPLSSHLDSVGARGWGEGGLPA